jgi:peptidoglycan DL-endopeptidase LytE
VKPQSAILTLLIFLFCFAAVSGAETRHTAVKGETLSGIAKKYHVDLKDLKEANKSIKLLKAGDKVKIPAPKQTAPPHAEPVSSRSAASKGHSDKKAPKLQGRSSDVLSPDSFHTVKTGDTLTSISKKYSVAISELRELNDLSNSSKIKLGQKLLLRSAEANVHIVKEGETIKSIAVRYDADPGELKEINEITSEKLNPGQKLYLSQDQPATAKKKDIEILKRTLEEEIKTVSESEEFSKTPVQDKIIVFAKKLMDIPYKFGGNSILGIDCSGYVKKVYGFLGIDLPRTAREQFNEGEAIDREELSIGDLVFFRTYASFPSHVGIYLGNNLFIHASEKAKKVRVDNLDAPYFVKRFIGAKRLLTDDDPDSAEPQILTAKE